MSHVGDPARNAATITPSDVTDLPAPTRAIYVGSAAGNISVVMYGGQTAIFTAVPIGVLPVQVTKVNAAGTTSTNLLALW